MSFPLSIWDLSLFTAMLSIILLTATALLYSRRGRISLLISKKKLRKTAMAVSLLFLATVLIRIASLV
jgi:hypothetical protein